MYKKYQNDELVRISEGALKELEKSPDKKMMIVEVYLESIYNYYEFSSGMARGSGCWIPFRDLRNIISTVEKLIKK